MEKVEIKVGMTNKSYRQGNVFWQEKVFAHFNHKIDYSILKIFDFVPKLLSNDQHTISWEFIEGKNFEASDENLRKITKIIKTLHNSKLKFPKSNHSQRVKFYQQILRDKNIKIEAIDKHYRRILTILKNSKHDMPLHNDLWPFNMIDKEGKIFLIDWEYASMGDKHFDLAYFIESAKLDDRQESVFLDEYDDYDYEYVIQQKILVNYLIILWVNAQETKHFDDAPFAHKIETLIEDLKNFKKTIK